jgi:VIT1/CCC1 family predicted Fe2+/Mn2+ transporter
VNIGSITADEERHEHELIALIDEDMLKYVSSIVLGLNDAIVELIGALSGFSLALQDNRLVLTAGLVTGIAGSLSMATSQYLSVKSEAGDKHPAKAAVYTGIAFMLAAVILVFPYLLFRNVFTCLGLAIFDAIFILFAFAYYISVTKNVPFMKRFTEMAVISLGVAVITFGFTALVSRLLNIQL